MISSIKPVLPSLTAIVGVSQSIQAKLQFLHYPLSETSKSLILYLINIFYHFRICRISL